jgi:hypothetical protein
MPDANTPITINAQHFRKESMPDGSTENFGLFCAHLRLNIRNSLWIALSSGWFPTAFGLWTDVPVQATKQPDGSGRDWIY